MDYRKEIDRMLSEIPFEIVLRYLYLIVKDVYMEVVGDV